MEKKKRITDRGEAYRFLLAADHGYLRELKEQVAENLINDFVNVGYIHIGMSGNWEETWGMNKFGREQFRAYISLMDMKDELNKMLLEF